jgi:hypothetical protein
MKKKGAIVSILCIILCIGTLTSSAWCAQIVTGVVFWDKNMNGIQDPREPGLPNVSVSNGKDVVQTDEQGLYTLPAYDEMIVFISKPAGFTPPLNGYNIPQFFYIHQPKGSPPEIKQFPGLSPTGPLPPMVNFPLYSERDQEKSFSPDHESRKFKAIITGDTQVYTDKEIDYLRDSFVKEVSDTDASFVISMGDNIGDNLSLYPRYLEVMSHIGRPIWLVPGNHDVNFDANVPANAFETFKRQFGPTYYSFNYGDVHFVVLNDILYPAPEFLPSKTYHGEIWGNQMEWLARDLMYVPHDKLIVLNMHIPVVSDAERLTPKDNVANRLALYDLLSGRKVVALAGHTHTIAHFQAGEQQEGWGQPLAFPEVIVGASCGSWWSGDLDNNGIPMSYQRDGAPRGYMIWSFDGNEYNDQFRASGKDPREQMHLSFLTPTFQDWFGSLLNWANQDSKTRTSNPPKTIKDLPDQGIIKQQDLGKIILVANVWNSSRDSKIACEFDSKHKFDAKRDTNIGDPYAQRLQAYVFRYAMGFQMFGTKQYGPAAPQPQDARSIVQNSGNFHLWTCKVPTNLEVGVHDVVVSAMDIHGNRYSQRMVFEVVK